MLVLLEKDIKRGVCPSSCESKLWEALMRNKKIKNLPSFAFFFIESHWICFVLLNAFFFLS